MTHIIASRNFNTSDGTLTLNITSAESEIPAFKFFLQNSRGETLEEFTAYGQDSIQALLHCLTAAGDTLQKFYPAAAWAENLPHCLPVSDITTDNVFRAVLEIPLDTAN